jgi:hypothetical protein
MRLFFFFFVLSMRSLMWLKVFVVAAIHIKLLYIFLLIVFQL